MGVPALPHFLALRALRDFGVICSTHTLRMVSSSLPPNWDAPSRDYWCIKEPDLTPDNCDKASGLRQPKGLIQVLHERGRKQLAKERGRKKEGRRGLRAERQA